MNNSPAFQFYPKDYLGSMKVRLMTPEERGGYVDLLCHAWLDDKCSLPDDDTVLATLSGLGERWFDVKDKIRPCFRKRGKRLISTRLKQERKKQKEWHEKSRLGGMKSGEVRRNKALELKGGSQMVQTKDEPNTNSSVCSLQSSSSSTSPKKIKAIKHKYGEYKNILLADKDYEQLTKRFGEEKRDYWIKEVDEGIELKGYKYKSHYMAILKWAKNTNQSNSVSSLAQQIKEAHDGQDN